MLLLCRDKLTATNAIVSACNNGMHRNKFFKIKRREKRLMLLME